MVREGWQVVQHRARQHGMRQRLTLAIGLALAALALACAPAASAAPPILPIENAQVTSFDGTKLDVSFYPAQGLTQGQTAPTVLEGSFWGLPAYSSLIGTVNSIGVNELFEINAELLGPATLTADGYNVITWDSRGWYASGGQVENDSPSYEGRDVTAIINWLATLPGAQLKGANDPVVGMTGFSYGGGVQLSAAAVDHRLAAIEPNMSWYSLVEALYPNQVIKAGWGNILCDIGDAVGARYAPELANTCSAVVTGNITPSEIAFGEAASPGPVVKQITTPTLLLAGTVDTLFPLNGDILTYDALRAAGTPVKMMWYCGGHGICNQNVGPTGHVTEAELTFLNKYLKGQSVSTGAGFEYLDQTGTWRSASSYPVASTGKVTASGGGTLGISPLDSSGLLGVQATSALNAVNIPVPAPSASVETLEDPQLTLTYSGLATKASTPIFAQLVDGSTGAVLDNQATPIPLTLNGLSHTVTVPLNLVTWNLTPSSKVRLQLTDASDLFFAQQATGLVSLQAKLTLPFSP
jgi:ABC-2 type transport system ATP-binding protein